MAGQETDGNLASLVSLASQDSTPVAIKTPVTRKDLSGLKTAVIVASQDSQPDNLASQNIPPDGVEIQDNPTDGVAIQDNPPGTVAFQDNPPGTVANQENSPDSVAQETHPGQDSTAKEEAIMPPPDIKDKNKQSVMQSYLNQDATTTTVITG